MKQEGKVEVLVYIISITSNGQHQGQVVQVGNISLAILSGRWENLFQMWWKSCCLTAYSVLWGTVPHPPLHREIGTLHRGNDQEGEGWKYVLMNNWTTALKVFYLVVVQKNGKWQGEERIHKNRYCQMYKLTGFKWYILLNHIISQSTVAMVSYTNVMFLLKWICASSGTKKTPLSASRKRGWCWWLVN